MQFAVVPVDEVHCAQCGHASYEGEGAYCSEDEDGSIIWFCEECGEDYSSCTL